MAKSQTIEVGCRWPNGLVLRPVEAVDDPLNPGSKMFREVEPITLNGPGSHTGGPGLPLDVAYTPVDADAFGKWFDLNKDADLVTSGAVFKKGDEPDDVKEALKAKEAAEEEREKAVEADRKATEAEAASTAAAHPTAGEKADTKAPAASKSK